MGATGTASGNVRQICFPISIFPATGAGRKLSFKVHNTPPRTTLNSIAVLTAKKVAYLTLKGEYEMGLLSWLIVGLIAGWLANQMMRSGRGNAVTDIIVGI